jgi:sucrose phosphorylase
MQTLSHETQQRLLEHLTAIYGKEQSISIMERLDQIAAEHVRTRTPRPPAKTNWNEQTSVLITYADSLQLSGEWPLVTLHKALNTHLDSLISCVHLLPFFPFCSDDGFSVIDYYSIRPDLGNWEHIRELQEDFGLMFDLVINHISRESEWFSDFIEGRSPEKDFFITVDPETNLSSVVRPRSNPLLVEVRTHHGNYHVWSTFSHDQIDLNYKSPELLLRMLEIVLFYFRMGARMLRLDAVAFIWKEIGTSCLHLPETHHIVKLIRDLVDELEPDCRLLTETNVPHHENVSYFGDSDEAHMVYQFSLPPLLMHALQTGQTYYLTQWALNLAPPPEGCTFFNFTASHDGVGLRPIEGIIPENEIQEMMDTVHGRGGFISKRIGPDGLEAPYEMNITYLDGLRDPIKTPDPFVIDRFMVSQAVALSLQGIPGIYIHSLLGTRNDLNGVERSGRIRSINRRKWDINELEHILADPASEEAQILSTYLALLEVRRLQKAFHPEAPQEIFDLGDALFGFRRTSIDGQQSILCLYNFTRYTKTLTTDTHPLDGHSDWFDLISNEPAEVDRGHGELLLPPYAMRWLVKAD